MNPIESYLLAGSILASTIPSVSAQSVPNTAIVSTGAELIAPGKFRPTLASLKQYEVLEWFRDAKFGIWAHWGPQSVPMEGDWYARRMYQQRDRDYTNHLERWGHPSTNG